MASIDELGNVTVTYEENPRDPFALESIRGNFARADKELEHLDFHWERIAMSGSARSGKELPDEDYFESRIASRIYVNIAMGVLDGREPSKEQILILDHFARQCSRALAEFQTDGSLPTEELRRYFNAHESTSGTVVKSVDGFDVGKALRGEEQ